MRCRGAFILKNDYTHGYRNGQAHGITFSILIWLLQIIIWLWMSNEMRITYHYAPYPWNQFATLWSVRLLSTNTFVNIYKWRRKGHQSSIPYRNLKIIFISFLWIYKNKQVSNSKIDGKQCCFQTLRYIQNWLNL